MKIYKILASLVLVTAIVIPSTLWGLLGTETGSRYVLEKSISLLPEQVALDYQRFDGTLLDTFEFTGLDLNIASQRFQAERLSITWSPMQLLQPELKVDRFSVAGVTITLPPSETTKDTAASIELPQLAVPISIRIDRMRVSDVGLYDKATGQRSTLIESFSAQAHYNQSDLRLRAVTLEQEFVALWDTDITVTTRNHYPLKLVSKWQLAQPESPKISGATSIEGSLQQLDFATSLTVAEEVISVTGIIYDPLADLRYELKANADQLTPNKMIGGLPDYLATSRLTASVNLNGNLNAADASADIELDINSDEHVQLTMNASATPERLLLKRLEVTYQGVEARASAPLQVTARGEIAQWLSATPAANLSLRWSEIPVPGTAVDVSFNEGELVFSGPLNDYQVRLNQQLHIGADRFQNQVIAQGNLERIATEVFAIQGPYLDFSSSLKISWLDKVEAELNIDQLALELAKIEALQSWIQASAEPLVLTANGGFYYQEDRVSVTDFKLSLGDNQLRVNGALPMQKTNATTADMGIRFASDLNDLAALSPYVGMELSGELALQGRLQGNPEQLDLTVEAFKLAEEKFGTWSLEAPTRVRLPPQRIYALSFDDWCLKSDVSQICTQQSFVALTGDSEVEGDAPAANQFIVTVEDFPLSTVTDITPENPAQLFGALNLTTQIEIATANGRLLGASGNLESDNARVVFPEQQQRLRFKETSLNWNLDQTDITAQLHLIPRGADGGLMGDIRISDWQQAGSINGQLNADFSDLTLIQSLVPQMTHESGAINADVKLSGTLEAPNYQGKIEISGQQLGFANVGLLINTFDLTVASDAEQTDVLDIAGMATANGGEISLSGVLDPLEPSFELQLQGQNFKVSDTPKLKLEVSPDVIAAYNADGLRLRGEVKVPFAHVTQPELGNNVAHSNDVVIYENGEPVTAAEASKIPLDAKLRLTLGEDVRVTAFGFDGLVGGSIEVTDDGVRAPTATGRIAVANGDYEIYGQALEIERGALIYTGGVLDNPGLDLRVRRDFEVNALSNDVQVGAQIGGTLTEPNLRLFSTPAMPDSQILSYLILGRGPATEDSNDSDLQLQAALMLGSQGVDFIGKELKDIFSFDEVGIDSGDNLNSSSFFIGKYLSPRLYVKYGIGLLEPTNTFFLRYELTDQLQLESTSTTEAQGGDLIYVIETN